MTTYRSISAAGMASRVVVIHCSDPRYQPHFQDFLRTGLGLNHYGLIAIPGGAQMLSPSESREALRNQGAAWFDFMSNLMTAERCILIGHADCRWYLENLIAPEAAALKETQARDLRAVERAIHKRFPLIRTELYFGEIQGEQAEFTMLQTVREMEDAPLGSDEHEEHETFLPPTNPS